MTLHGSDVALIGRLPGAEALARRVLARAARVTAVSTALAARAAQLLGRGTDDIPVVPMPAELGTTPAAPLECRRGIVTVGRLTRQKRVDLVLRTAAALAARGRPQAVTIVGDGPDRARLQRLATALRLDDVSFTGSVPPAAVANYLAAAVVALFPARGEGFGLAAAEALMCGVPVVAATDGGGLLDIVPPDGPGRRVPPDHPDLWADAVEALATNLEAREQAWSAGRTWRARLDPDLVAARFEAIYAGA